MTPRTGTRILFAGGGTGGHLYPALALGDAVRRADPDAAVMYVGAERGVEARVLPERGVPHTLLPLEPIRRSRPWENWRLVPAMLRSGSGLRRVFRDFRPDVVVGTGGYASGPAVAWALLSRVPTALQEQNSYPGLVTRWLAPRVRQLHLAFPEAKRHLKLGSTTVFELGNPIQPPDLDADRAAARARFGLGDGPVVLVVGGSQGARAINEALLADLRGVVEGGCPSGRTASRSSGPPGRRTSSPSRDGSPRWAAPSGSTRAPTSRRCPPPLPRADLAISRAGAMALAELCAWGSRACSSPSPTPPPTTSVTTRPRWTRRGRG
jgi:UDP-N-acetylglucosamine--N-acetylmuramyl-(pentapeptide) pyrophosphoryl-undecaprenol N-acetylglucosamine transferase